MKKSIDDPYTRRVKSGVAAAMVAVLSLASLFGATSVAFAQEAPAEAAVEEGIAVEEAEEPSSDEEAAIAAPSAQASLAVAIAVSAEVVTQAARNAKKQAWQHGSIPGGTLMLVAYFALWIFIFGMIFLTMRRQRALNREMDELGRRMDVVFEDLE